MPNEIQPMYVPDNPESIELLTMPDGVRIRDVKKMNGVLCYDSALVRLYRAVDNLRK